MRSPESAADGALRRELAEEGILVSRYQLERWRQHGLLPRAVVVRERFGGSRTTPHPEATYDAARILGQMMGRGSRWQFAGAVLFGEDLPLSEATLRECAVWIVDQAHSLLMECWEEAGRLATPNPVSPEDERFEIAQIAVGLARRKRRLRGLMRVVRSQVAAFNPTATLAQQRDAFETSMLYRLLDIHRPGSLTEAETWLAISGVTAPDFREVTPLLPSAIRSCAETLTLAESYATREFLLAAHGVGLIELSPYSLWLEDVLLHVLERRLEMGTKDPATPMPADRLQELLADARSMMAEADQGISPFQEKLWDDTDDAADHR